MLDKAVIGVRREESAKRASRYKEPTQCRVYKKGERAEQIFPILDWTSQDIIDFADDRKLKFAPLYYDDEGKFHVERRLGCMCCPLASKKHRIEEFRKHNGMIKLYLRNIQKYMDSHPDSKMTRENVDCYGSFARDLFYTKKGAWKATNSGLFKHDFKRELEQFFETDLTI